MQRINAVDPATAPEKSRELLTAVKSQMGMVPNILATMAQSPASLGAYLNFAGALNSGVFTGKMREQVALAVAGANGCDYCASVHAALGSQHGLDQAEIAQNLRGRSSDAKTGTALSFVHRVIAQKGHVSDAELASVRNAGFDDEQVVELIALTALNIFTNYFNHVASTEIDFPKVEAQAA